MSFDRRTSRSPRSSAVNTPGSVLSAIQTPAVSETECASGEIELTRHERTLVGLALGALCAQAHHGKPDEFQAKCETALRVRSRLADLEGALEGPAILVSQKFGFVDRQEVEVLLEALGKHAIADFENTKLALMPRLKTIKF
jgi:hypothetical protein